MMDEIKAILLEVNGSEIPGVQSHPVPGVGHYAVGYCPEHNQVWSMSAATPILLADGRTVKGILVDDEWVFGLATRQDMQSFFLAHEMGHWELGHIDCPESERTRRNELRMKGDPEAFGVELAADRWAITHCPETLDAGLDLLTRLIQKIQTKVESGEVPAEEANRVLPELVVRQGQLIRIKTGLDKKEVA